MVLAVRGSWAGALVLLALFVASRGLADADGVNLGLAVGDVQRVDGPTAVFAVFEPAQGQDLDGDGALFSEVVHVFDARRGTTRNLGLAASGLASFVLQDDLVVALAQELGRDLNGDGDVSDSVLHVFETRSGRLRNLQLAVPALPDRRILDGRLLPFAVSEFQQGNIQQGGIDLNGDGDAEDGVVHYLDLRTMEVVNTGLAPFSADIRGASPVLADRFMVLSVNESAQGRVDLNGDGDLNDDIIHVFDTRLLRARNLGLSGSTRVSGRVLVLSVSEPAQTVDLNGDGDLNDSVLHLVTLRSGQVTNLRLSSTNGVFVDAATDLAVFPVSEKSQGNRDLTGDGVADDFPVHVIDLRSRSVRNLGLSALNVDIAPQGRAVLGVIEAGEGRDLNDDGDARDEVLHVVDLARRRTVNTRLDFQSVLLEVPAVKEFFPFLVHEERQGRDLNGDGDALDDVLHVTSLRTSATLNSGLDGAAFGPPTFPGRHGASGARIVVPVTERRQGGMDLNGDGDANDVVLHVFDARQRSATNLRLPVRTIPGDFGAPDTAIVFGGAGIVSVAVPEANGSVDLNGDGDTLDDVLHLVDIESGTITNAARAVDAGTRFVGAEFVSGGSNVGTFRVDSPREGGAYTFLVSESANGNVDLNGDGDALDLVIHATRLRDLDGDGRFDFADDRIGRRGP